MELSTIILIIVVIGIILFVAWLLKSLIAFALLAIVAYLLFHIGFIWGFDEVNERLHLDKFLKPEVAEQVEDKYNTFEQKREEYGVVETEEMKRVVDETLEKAWKEAGEAYESIDKEALVNNPPLKILKDF